MFIKNLVKITALSITAVLLLLAMTRTDGAVTGLPVSELVLNKTFDSPLPTPQPTPLAPPTPTPPPSPYVQVALRYLATTKGIPIQNLLVAHEHSRRYPLSGRDFMALSILDTVGRELYHLLVDRNDYSVVEDIDSVIKAELWAYNAKYGKFDPLLYGRIQNADPNERIPVAIWIGGERGRSRAALYDALAQRYPQVREALEQHKGPFDVGDAALARQVREEYLQMRREDVGKRIQPLVTQLNAEKHIFQTHDLIPAISASIRV